MYTFVVKNHGIADEIIQNALCASKEFFSLLIEQKMEVSVSEWCVVVVLAETWYRLRTRRHQISRDIHLCSAATTIQRMPAISKKGLSSAMNHSNQGLSMRLGRPMAQWQAQMFGHHTYQAFAKLRWDTSNYIWISWPLVFANAVTTSHAAVGLGKLLFPIFALSLDLPENFFDDKVLW